MRSKGSAKELEQRRRQAVSLLEKGLRSAAVARAVGTLRASVTRWRQAHEKKGDSMVVRTLRCGGMARLTSRQRRQLFALLTQ